MAKLHGGPKAVIQRVQHGHFARDSDDPIHALAARILASCICLSLIPAKFANAGARAIPATGMPFRLVPWPAWSKAEGKNPRQRRRHRQGFQEDRFKLKPPSEQQRQREKGRLAGQVCQRRQQAASMMGLARWPSQPHLFPISRIAPVFKPGDESAAAAVRPANLCELAQKPPPCLDFKLGEMRRVDRLANK